MECALDTKRRKDSVDFSYFPRQPLAEIPQGLDIALEGVAVLSRYAVLGGTTEGELQIIALLVSPHRTSSTITRIEPKIKYTHANIKNNAAE